MEAWTSGSCLGPLAYVIAGLRAITESQPHLEVTNEQTNSTGELVLIGNGQRYGGRFRLFPEANLCDGLIHACVFSSVRLRDLPRRVWGLLTQRLPQQSGVTMMAGSTLTLTGPAHVKFELEGDLTGNLPVTFRIAPSKLRIIAPKSSLKLEAKQPS